MVERRVAKNEREGDKLLSVMHIVLYDMYSKKYLFLLGTDMTPNPLSGRFVIIFVLFLSVTLYDYYTSVFVSTLIKSGSRNKIKTIRDLADSEFEVGFEEIPYIHSFLRVTTTTKQ